MSSLPEHTARADQAYYWADGWQADEAAAVAELERGEGHRFATPAEAVDWLRAAELDRVDPLP